MKTNRKTGAQLDALGDSTRGALRSVREHVGLEAAGHAHARREARQSVERRTAYGERAEEMRELYEGDDAWTYVWECYRRAASSA